MTPEERIRANVMAALGKAPQPQPVKKQNLFVKGICKSASRTRSTDLAEIIEVCEQLPVTNATCAALCLICCHNNTQVREAAGEQDERGIITAEEMSIATSKEFTATDFTLTIIELMACGVLSLDDEGFYRVALYAE